MQDHPIVVFQVVQHHQKAPTHTKEKCIKHHEQTDVKKERGGSDKGAS